MDEQPITEPKPEPKPRLRCFKCGKLVRVLGTEVCYPCASKTAMVDLYDALSKLPRNEAIAWLEKKGILKNES